ncbi:MAG: sugar transferase, partial [Candidatus Omnitrophica bacterium]|nr:sugar transferase [Candidatus Omnitrophota bacterium]
FPSNKKNFALEKLLVYLTIFGDLIFIVLSDLSAFTLRFQTEIIHPPLSNFYAYLKISIPIVVIRLITFYAFGLYYNLRFKSNFEITTAVLKASFLSTLIIVFVAFYFRALAYPRLVIILSLILTASLCILWRIILRAIISVILGKDITSSRIIIIGIDKYAQRLGLHMIKRGSIQYELLGFINPGDEIPQDLDPLVKILGTLDDLDKLTDKEKVDEVIIATKNITRKKLIKTLINLNYKGISCKVVPEDYEAIIGHIIATPIDDLNPVFLRPLEEEFYWYRGFKRVFDLILSIVILIFTLPFMLIIGLLIKLTSEGPILYKQERIGLYGRPFILYKFRTMYKDAEESGPLWATENDSRITPLGRMLRKTRLDELPQLINVIKNDMSLVGPRPERMCFVETLKKEIPFYLERLTVKPGITGWAQITFPYADSIESSREKFIHDLFYIKNMSLLLDLFILLKTFWIILLEKGAH